MVELRGQTSEWLADVAEIIREVEAYVASRSAFLRMSVGANRIYLSTSGATNDDFHSICLLTAGAASRMLALGYLVRGAIAAGQVCHVPQAGGRHDALFGPGLIRVSELVARFGIYPRIVIDPDLRISGMDESIPVDSDGVRILDVFGLGFLADYWAQHPRYRNKPALPEADVERAAALIRQTVSETNDPALIASLEWLVIFLARPRRLPN